VGIEHRHKVLKKNSAVSLDRRNKITKDSESSTKWALIRCRECTEDRTVGCYVRRYSTSTRRAFESVCRQEQRREENPLSYGI
jgi:hypothetical protein